MLKWLISDLDLVGGVGERHTCWKERISESNKFKEKCKIDK